MKPFFAIDSLVKTTVLSFAALGLVACGGNDAATKSSGNLERSQYELAGDHAIGDPNAPITVVEYASVTCGACANWHAAVYPELRKKYIDTGKVRFVFREFPTPPENLATVGFLIANCAAEDKFFQNISLQFERQRELINSAREGRARAEYEALAKVAGLSTAEYEACLKDEDERAKLDAVIREGRERGISSTPSFIINGVQEKVFTLEQFEEKFAAYIDIPKPESEMDSDAAPAAEE